MNLPVATPSRRPVTCTSLVLGLILGLLGMGEGALQSAGASYAFNNSTPGSIVFAKTGASRQSSIYPSEAVVSGVPAGTVTSVRITLNTLTLARPDDAQMVLVAPSGKRLVFWADAGTASIPISGFTVTVDDAAASALPDASALANGASYKPACYNQPLGSSVITDFAGTTPSVSLAAGDLATPAGSATFTSQFGGAFTLAAPGGSNPNPNGTWSLYTYDDVSSDDVASIGSWTLTIVSDLTTVATTTTLASSSPSSTTGVSVIFTATVRQQTDNAAVTTGTVTFKDGTTVLASLSPLNVLGQASLDTSSLTEGDHTISAEYVPASGFLGSSATVAQRVDNATTVAGGRHANTGALSIPSTGTGTATVYPSRVVVSGLSGSISRVNLRLTGISVDRGDDLEALLVGPGGQSFAFLGDAGGTATPLVAVDLTFDDTAASLIPDSTPPATGTYRPTSYDTADSTGSAPSGSSSLPPPSGPYPRPATQDSATFSTIFAGASPNGTWSLYLYDDVVGGGVTVSGGWSLSFVTTGDASTSTTLESSSNPSLVGDPVTVTATVVTSPGGVPVTSGTVTFREGATVLAGPTALDGSGQASFVTSSFTEGSHLISADYSGSPGAFNVSTSATLYQRVDGLTTVIGQTYCNPSPLTVSSSAPSLATVYPSHLHVAVLAGPITAVQLQLNGLTVDRPDDVELLLVGPTSANLVVLNDGGGTSSAVNGINVVLADTAANLVPDAGPWAGGTYRPTSHPGTTPSFPSPAPAGGSLVQAAPEGTGTLATQFNGTSAVGTWSLYARDDVGGAGFTLTGGWCLAFEVNSPPEAGPDTLHRDKDRSVKVPIATLLANDSDPNGTQPTFVEVSPTSANGAAVRVVGSWLNYEAAPGVNGTDSFTYTLTDGVSTSTGTVTVQVTRPAGQTLNLAIAGTVDSVALTLWGIPGRTYQFEHTDSLIPPVAWNPLGAPQVADAAGRAAMTDTSGLTRFYRAMEP